MAHSHDTSSDRPPQVMLAGLGHAGVKALLTATRQFGHPDYLFAAVDTPQNLEGLEAPEEDGDFQARFQWIPMQESWEQKLPDLLKDLKMVVLILGLGGKTAPEAAKTFAKAAALLSLPVVILATTPFTFEGEQKKTAANRALSALRPHVNSVIILPNDVLFSDQSLAPDTNAAAAFERVDAWIAEVATSILKPFTLNNVFNVSRENLDWLLRRKNATCSVGIGWGEGEDAVLDAVAQLSQSPFLRLLPDATQADAALVMVSLPEETTIAQVTGCLEAVKRLFSPQLKLEIGACTDATIAEGVRIVTVMRFPTRQLPQTYANATPEERAELLQDDMGAGAQEVPEGADNALGGEADAMRPHGLPPEQQLMLPITVYSTGFFSSGEPTKYNFENLDVPTYLRRKVRLD